MWFRQYYRTQWLIDFNNFVSQNSNRKLWELWISESLKRLLGSMINRAIREAKQDKTNN